MASACRPGALPSKMKARSAPCPASCGVQARAARGVPWVAGSQMPRMPSATDGSTRCTRSTPSTHHVSVEAVVAHVGAAAPEPLAVHLALQCGVCGGMGGGQRSAARRPVFPRVTVGSLFHVTVASLSRPPCGRQSSRHGAPPPAPSATRSRARQCRARSRQGPAPEVAAAVGAAAVSAAQRRGAGGSATQLMHSAAQRAGAVCMRSTAWAQVQPACTAARRSTLTLRLYIRWYSSRLLMYAMFSCTSGYCAAASLRGGLDGRAPMASQPAAFLRRQRRQRRRRQWGCGVSGAGGGKRARLCTWARSLRNGEGSRATGYRFATVAEMRREVSERRNRHPASAPRPQRFQGTELQNDSSPRAPGGATLHRCACSNPKTLGACRALSARLRLGV